MPPTELPAFLNTDTRDIECDEQQEHRDREVVRYNHRHQDIGKGEIKNCQQCGIPAIQGNNLTMDAIEEYIGIVRTDDQW